MVEIEIGVPAQPMPGPPYRTTKERLIAEIDAWQQQRNADSGQNQLDVHNPEGPRKTPQGLPVNES